MKIKTLVLSFLILCSFLSVNAQEQFIGEIRLFAGNFAPRGWVFCNGQMMSINQNTALFSVLGTTYGGNGQSTFALPDLRSRVPVHTGSSQAPGLNMVVLGEMGGSETSVVNPPVVSVTTNGVKLDASTTGRDGVPTLVTSVIVNNGTQPQKLDNRSPYLGLNYIICVEGYYPSRN